MHGSVYAKVPAWSNGSKKCNFCNGFEKRSNNDSSTWYTINWGMRKAINTLNYSQEYFLILLPPAFWWWGYCYEWMLESISILHDNRNTACVSILCDTSRVSSILQLQFEQWRWDSCPKNSVCWGKNWENRQKGSFSYNLHRWRKPDYLFILSGGMLMNEWLRHIPRQLSCHIIIEFVSACHWPCHFILGCFWKEQKVSPSAFSEY